MQDVCVLCVLGSNHFSMHISADSSTTVTGLEARARLLGSVIWPDVTAKLKGERAGGLAHGEMDRKDLESSDVMFAALFITVIYFLICSILHY